MALAVQRHTDIRRKYPRRDFKRNMGVLFNGEYVVCQGFEIGEGGISFLYPQELPEHLQAVVSFQVPGGGFTSVQVEVRRSFQHDSTDQFVIGCSFKEVSFEIKREIRTYVSARS